MSSNGTTHPVIVPRMPSSPPHHGDDGQCPLPEVVQKKCACLEPYWLRHRGDIEVCPIRLRSDIQWPWVLTRVPRWLLSVHCRMSSSQSIHISGSWQPTWPKP